MQEHNIAFKVVVTPIGKISRFVHWLTKRFYVLNSSILIRSNEIISQPIPKDQ